MDKHKSIHKKIDLLSEHLAAIPHESIYIMPAVRELLEKKGSGFRVQGSMVKGSKD
jgi:hypothetical protein